MHTSCCVTDKRAGGCQLSAGACGTRGQQCLMWGWHHVGCRALRGLGQPRGVGSHRQADGGCVLPPEKRRGRGRSRQPWLCYVPCGPCCWSVMHPSSVPLPGTPVNKHSIQGAAGGAGACAARQGRLFTAKVTGIASQDVSSVCGVGS